MMITNLKIGTILTLLLSIASLSYAQNDTWCVVMTQGTHAESYEHKSEFPSTFISAQWAKRQYITELTYDGAEWWVVTGAKPYTQQSYKRAKTFPSDWISEKWNEGYDITNVEYGGGEWVAVMSKGAGYSGETWGKRGSFKEIQDYIKTKWNDKKDIIDIAYGNGEWVAVLAYGADYDLQVYRWEATFPHAWVQEKYKSGYNITNVTYGEGNWIVVMSKYTKQKAERYQCLAEFPKSFVQEQWDAGKRFSFMHYNYEKNLQNSFDELLNAGLAAANDEDHHLAIYYYTEALKVKPNSDVCYNNLAWSKYILGQCSGALSDANKSIQINAADYSYHTRASILICLGRCHDAISDFDKALAITNSKESYYYGDRGLARACLGDYEDAIKDFNKALSIEPGNKDYKDALADAQSKVNQNTAPTVTWDHPYKTFTASAESSYKIKACIHSKAAITDVKVYVNGKSFASRGFGLDDDCTQSVDQTINLAPGKNEIEILVMNGNKTTRSEKRTIEYKAATVGGNYHALLIAVENYEDFAIKDLEKPIDDATELQKVLTQNYTFEPGNVHLLKNPKKEEILNKLIYLQDRLGPNDNLLVYYSGHGIVKNDVGYWLPSNAAQDSRIQWLSNAELRDYMNGMKAKHTLIIADACFSGSIFTGGYRDFEEFACEEMAKLKSRRAMTSGANTVVPDNSVFFKYLVQKLKENNSSCLSAENLYSKIKPAVIYNSPNNHVPQFGVLPQTGDEGGNFVFKRR